MKIKNQYVLDAPLHFLQTLPTGYCGTAVAAPPVRVRPLKMGRSSGWTREDNQRTKDDYLELHRSVIGECLRVVGPTGVLFYHFQYETSSRLEMDLRHDILRGFPFRQAIIWNHNARNFSPRRRYPNRLPNNYGMIFIFSGPRWSIPEEYRAEAMYWGDVWDIELDYRHDPWVSASHDRGQRRPYSFPDELADRLVALGSDMVVEPFAATGSTALAAIRAGRDWLACDENPEYLEAFKMRSRMRF